MRLKLDGRLQKLRQQLEDKELDGILISQPENRYYLSGFNGSAGSLLITPRDAALATDFRYIEQARAQAPGYEVTRVTGDIADWLPPLMADCNIKRLGFEAEYVSFATYKRLTDAVSKADPKYKLVPGDGVLESLRAIKEPEELAYIMEAVELADRALAHVREIVHIGMREDRLAWEIERFLREQGSQVLPFAVIVASGPNSALPHARPTYRAIRAGEPVVIDIGARIGHYCSDLSRTIWVGAAEDTLRKVYDIVLGAQLTALSLIQEGMTGDAADRMARTAIDEAGYGEEFGHGLGHGIGLGEHELPRLGPKSTDQLAEGMVFTVEPGIYLPGWGGVRIEDVAVLAGGELKVLTKAGKVYHDR